MLDLSDSFKNSGVQMNLNLFCWIMHGLLTSFEAHCLPHRYWHSMVQDIADIYEKEENVQRAMEYYEKAAELYSGEGIDSTANQCKIKVAQFAAQLEQYISVPSLVPS
jgi:tetratricopeptide (TPR) repeat protein